MLPRRGPLPTLLAAALALIAGGPAAAAVPPGSWSRSITLAAPAENLGSPAIAISRRGAAVAAWTNGFERGSDLGFGRVASGRRIYARYRRPGGSFGPPIAISPAGADPDFVTVGIDDRGRALLLWERPTIPPTYGSPGSKGAVYLTRLEPRRRPVTARLSPRGIAAGRPALAVAPGGSAVAAWWETTSWGFFGSVRQRVVAAGGTTGGPMDARPLSAEGAVYGSVASADTSAPSVATSASGAAAVAWRRAESSSAPCCVRVEVAAFRPPTGFGPVLVADDGAGGKDAQDVRAAVAGDGSPRVVWRSIDSPLQGACCGRLLAWEPGSAPAPFSTPGADALAPVALGLRGDRLAVAWLERARVRVAIASGGIRFAAPATLSARDRTATGPQLAAAPDGALVAAWTRWVAGGDGTWRVEAATASDGPFGTPRFLSRAVPRGPVQDLALSPSSDAPAAAIWLRDGRAEAAALGTGLGADPVPDYLPPRLTVLHFGAGFATTHGRRRRLRDVLTVRASEPGTLEIVSADTVDYSAEPGVEQHERTVVRLRRGVNVVLLHRFLARTAWDPSPSVHFIELTPRDRTGNVGSRRDVGVGRQPVE
ncbi:MAG: hypothetical protein U0T02_10940 [Solirubrobacteraceae bacterium]